MKLTRLNAQADSLNVPRSLVLNGVMASSPPSRILPEGVAGSGEEGRLFRGRRVAGWRREGVAGGRPAYFPTAGWQDGGGPGNGKAEHAPRFTVGSQSPRGSYLVPLYEARGGPQVCLLFAFRNQPIATPRAASELHWRDGPHFKGIARPNILRTGIQRLDHFLTASSAARGRRSEPPRYGEQRSARASD